LQLPRLASTAIEVAKKSELEAVLQCKLIGGNPLWNLAEFIDPAIWKVCGEQDGMQAVARKFMTLLASGARDPPIDPICPSCGELTCMHAGDRLNLKVVSCACTLEATSAQNASKRKATEQPQACRARLSLCVAAGVPLLKPALP
jgi:hypothetical protein